MIAFILCSTLTWTCDAQLPPIYYCNKVDNVLVCDDEPVRIQVAHLDIE